MTIRLVRLIAILLVVMSLSLFSNMQGFSLQPSYATTQQEGGIRTFSIKVILDKSVIQQGETQTIHFRLSDQKTHLPISGAVTSATVAYADGETVRHWSVITDKSGRSSISWKIGDTAPTGVYNLVYSASQVAYVSESFGGSFSVVGANVVDSCLSTPSSTLCSSTPSSTSSSTSSLTSSSSSSSSPSMSSSSSSPSMSSSSLCSSTSSSLFDTPPTVLDIGGPSASITPTHLVPTPIVPTPTMTSQTSQTCNQHQ
ncbi:MAG TPA: hypothetical protein VH796_03555 [Nitrososphaeraceae archaeon]